MKIQNDLFLNFQPRVVYEILTANTFVDDTFLILVELYLCWPTIGDMDIKKLYYVTKILFF